MQQLENWRQICCLQQIFYHLLKFRDVYKELDAAVKGGRKLRGEVQVKSWVLNCSKQVKVLRKELREREQKAMASILSRAEVR